MRFEQVLPRIRAGGVPKLGGKVLEGASVALQDLLSDKWDVDVQDHRLCPFCGGQAVLTRYGETAVGVACTGCNSGTAMDFKDSDSAWAAWDRRA